MKLPLVPEETSLAPSLLPSSVLDHEPVDVDVVAVDLEILKDKLLKDIGQVRTIMDGTEFILSLDLCDLTDFTGKLLTLGGLVSRSGENEEVRRNLVTVVGKLVDLIRPNLHQCDDIEYLRILRGCIMLLRNVCIELVDVDGIFCSKMMRTTRKFFAAVEFKEMNISINIYNLDLSA